MTIDDDTRATIVRLFRIEGWPVGTIARELGLHHSTVTRALQQAAGAPQERPPRPSMIDPYLPFVRQTLQSWPELHASRLYQPALPDGLRARLSGRSRSLPSPDRAVAAAPAGRSVSAPAFPARRAGSARLGRFRDGDHRPGRAQADGVRDDTEPFAAHDPAVLSRRADEQLPARPCRRLPCVRWRAPCSPLR